jgi:transcriptional regulator with XRE-family HTH domain
MKWGEKIWLLRVSKKIQQQNLAQHMGVSTVYLHRLEKGKAPEIKKLARSLVKMARIFDMTVDELLKGVDDE